MKTVLLSIILIICFTVAGTGKPINEIYSIQEPVLSEESYVNDIPFNTWDVAVDAILTGDEAKLEDETYVDDIPFSTREIACRHILSRMLEETGEININDIPFNTERIYCEYLAELLIEKYRNEANINDFPEKKYLINRCRKDGGQSYMTVRVKSSDKYNVRPRRMDRFQPVPSYPSGLLMPSYEVIEVEPPFYEERVCTGFSL